MVYWECFYHIVWATYRRQPLLEPALESFVFAKVREKSEWANAAVHGINGVADHLHIAVSIPPKLAVSEWVRNVKGYVSREVNATFTELDHPFRWQASYGVLTFGQRQLEYVLQYIWRQKEHHATNTIQPRLEATDQPD